MLDYRLPLDYAIVRTEDRVRDARGHVPPQNNGIRRVFRIGESRPTIREMGRR